MTEPSLVLGDCVVAMAAMEPESIDAIVTDPPYGLSEQPDIAEVLRHWLAGDDYEHRGGGFMGKTWDSFVPGPVYWRECLRLLKPGGYCLCFGGTRTVDMLTIALRIAGFEIRDRFWTPGGEVMAGELAWMYGSGFPKSLSVHKATVALVESRYGSGACDCLDARDGRADRDDLGCEGGSDTRVERGPGPLPTTEARLPGVEGGARGVGGDSVRSVREGGQASSSGSAQGKDALLLPDVRGLGAEAEGFGDTAVRPGLEERADEDKAPRQEVSVLWQDGGAERQGAGGASSRAVQVRGVESSEEPTVPVRRVPSDHRGDHDERASVDPDRREARRLVLDDQGGRQRPVAWACSWCGLPDSEWLDSLRPLGSALKPAHEPVVVARKPLVGTVSSNVLAHGTGALNIDACRIGVSDADPNRRDATADEYTAESLPHNAYGDGIQHSKRPATLIEGRWPANVVLVHHEECRRVGERPVDSDGHWPAKRTRDGGIGQVGHSGQEGLEERSFRKVKSGTAGPKSGGIGSANVYSPSASNEEGIGHEHGFGEGGYELVEAWDCHPDCPVRELDAQTADLQSPGNRRPFSEKFEPGGHTIGRPAMTRERMPEELNFGDSGGASRFFYTAKSSRAERNAGLEGFMERRSVDDDWVSENRKDAPGEWRPSRQANRHPTVKPIALMRWMIRLICPPGGRVLDPFLGSGSTGCAAMLEGCVGEFVGIEQDEEYLRIAEARIAFWREHGEDGLRIVREREARERQGEKRRQEKEELGQLDLLG